MQIQPKGFFDRVLWKAQELYENRILSRLFRYGYGQVHADAEGSLTRLSSDIDILRYPTK